MAEKSNPISDNIVTTVESPESWKRVISVEISRSFFDKEYRSRLKKAVKSHQKPGFRKGRTPKAMVEREVGEMLHMEAMESMVPKAWMAAVMEHKLAPITDPKLENLKFEDDEPLRFELITEVRPEVELQDMDNLKVQKREAVVTDKEIDEVLVRLQDSKASFEAVERESKDEDQVTLDLVPGTGDGEPDEGKIITDQKFVLGSANNMPAFNEELAGVKVGDVRDVEVAYPDDHPNEGLRGQKIIFNCRIKEVAEKKVPDLDDEFAGTLEEGKTLEELKSEISKDLAKELDRRIAQEMDEQALRGLVMRHELEIPPSMTNRYLESGLKEMHARNAQVGRPNSEEEDAEYRTAGKVHAEKALMGMLVMEAVQKKEDIKVQAEDVEDRITEIAEENGFDVDRYREFVNSGEEKEKLEYDLLERRTYDFLLSRADIEAVSADTDVLADKEK
jgi:trigger factor